MLTKEDNHMDNSLVSPQCVGYRKVVLIQEKPFEIKKVGEDNGNSGEKETVHENTDNSDEQT